MSDVNMPKRVALIHRERGAVILERSLALRGWVVTQFKSGRALPTQSIPEYDALLVVLDHEDPDTFELLLRLSNMSWRPRCLLLTKRPSRSLTSEVLAELGVDAILEWPCRIDVIVPMLSAPAEPMRYVS